MEITPLLLHHPHPAAWLPLTKIWLEPLNYAMNRGRYSTVHSRVLRLGRIYASYRSICHDPIYCTVQLIRTREGGGLDARTEDEMKIATASPALLRIEEAPRTVRKGQRATLNRDAAVRAVRRAGLQATAYRLRFQGTPMHSALLPSSCKRRSGICAAHSCQQIERLLSFTQ